MRWIYRDKIDLIVNIPASFQRKGGMKKETTGSSREGIVTLLKTVSEIITHPIVEQALNYGGSMLNVV